MRPITQGATRLGLAMMAAISLSPVLSAADAAIRGIVTDNAGQPVRAAIVTATQGNKSVSRYAQNDGRYEITVPTGTYDLSAQAYGFATSKKQTKDTTQAGDTNFKLSPKLDIDHLSGAELEELLPDNQQTRMIRSTCGGCHSFDTIIRRRGSTADQWQGFLPTMTAGRMFQPVFSAQQLASLGPALEKYFGPDATFFGPDADAPTPEQVKHTPVSDAALNGTVTEYRVPTPGVWVHSVAVDPTRDIAWFSEYDFQSNKVGRFNIDAEKFVEYPISAPNSMPHTPIVGKDGRLWMTLAGTGIDTKLVSVEPDTGRVTEYKWPEKKAGTHTVKVAPDGTLWMASMGSSDEFMSFNAKTEQFKAYKHTLPATYPEVSAGAYEGLTGNTIGITYDVAVDSQGDAWFTETRLGTIARVDPATGETTEYKPPETPNMNGIMVDSHDNVWFSDFMGHKLGKLDPKTKTFKMYQPPTQGARPYGIVEDRKTGDIWFADYNGNNITRFDPKTEKFVEYPIPTHGAYPRFVGQDSKGRIWFAEWWSGKIGVVDPGGSKQVASR